VNCRSEKDKFRKLVADPAFIRDKEFDKGLYAIQRTQSKICLNKCISAGLSVLDLSKLVMYGFYYKHLKPKYGNKMKLLYTDTDSLDMFIETEDIYEDMLKYSYLYDLSNFPEDFETSKGQKMYSAVNKKVIAKLKDEFPCSPISEFVSLRAKMYSVLTADGVMQMKAKGIPRAVVKYNLKHEIYKECLETGKETKETIRQIKSDHHRLYKYKYSKIALSPFDSKRYLCSDGNTTLAFGHCRIKDEASTVEPAVEPAVVPTVEPTAEPTAEPTVEKSNIIKRICQSLVGFFRRICYNLQLFTNK